MKIENAVYRLTVHGGGGWLQGISDALATALGSYKYPLRFSVIDVEEHQAIVEATVVHYSSGEQYSECFNTIELLAPRRRATPTGPFVAVQILPTGVRCEFGGFAGDACPVTNLLASAVDLLVTHPNAVNASDLNEMAANVLYVEGKSLDDFLLGHLGLLPATANRIGTFVDPTGIDYLDYVVNTLQAAKAVKGLDCDIYTVLKQELGVAIEWSSKGCAVGVVLRPEEILEGVERLLEHGVQAVGGVSVIHGVTQEMFSRHLDGKLPNPSGGVEAIITHLISKVFRIPAAHAPLPYYQDIKEKDTRNPRASAEFISTPHYFSVLKGLARAPRLIPLDGLRPVPSQALNVDNIGAIVMPASCLGGVPALAAEFHEIPLIAVRENSTVLNVTNAKVKMRNVIEVESYLEATGVVLALREGISLESLRRPLGRARRIDSGDVKRIASARELEDSLPTIPNSAI